MRRSVLKRMNPFQELRAPLSWDSNTEISHFSRLFRFLHWVKTRSLIGKSFLATGTVLGMIPAYVSLCTFVHWMHTKELDEQYLSSVTPGVLRWDEDGVADSLKPGDLVLLYGTGSMSWKITNSQFALSCMTPSALKFSHVGVIVKARDPKTKQGPWMLEAVDNHDVQALDIDGVKRLDSVQVVEVKQRIFGFEGARPCYKRCAIRKLHRKFEWTSQRLAAAEAFLKEYVGRPMDKNPLVMAAYFHPSWYAKLGGRQPPKFSGKELTCSELVARFLREIDVFDAPLLVSSTTKRKSDGQDDPLRQGTDRTKKQDAAENWVVRWPFVDVAPAHFTHKMEQFLPYKSGEIFYGFEEPLDVSILPER